MFDTAVTGSLPKPGWLAETGKLWPQWRAEGDALQQAKLDATLVWIKQQEDAGLIVIGDGEMSRQHFVHGFLEQVDGIDREHKVEMGIRAERYKAMVPQVVGPLRPKGRVHAAEARFLCAHTTRRVKFTLPGPMTIVDTVFKTFPGRYFTGDGAKRDEDGYYWITGRVDDVLNVAGHRLGTAEIESALVAHAKVAEAAVVG